MKHALAGYSGLQSSENLLTTYIPTPCNAHYAETKYMFPAKRNGHSVLCDRTPHRIATYYYTRLCVEIGTYVYEHKSQVEIDYTELQGVCLCGVEEESF